MPELPSNEALGKFLSMVSHDMRSHLTAIKGSLGIMLEGATGEFNEEQKDFLDTAFRNADRLEVLVDNVFDYQRLEAGLYEFKLVAGDVNHVVEVVCGEVDKKAQKKKLNLITIKADNLPRVMMDTERLKRVVRNVVDNAIKFTESGEVLIKTSIELDQVAIIIKDTGVGMSPQDKDEIFERFSKGFASHTKKAGGIGLGLVIAQKIIKAHHGTFNIESKPAEGSTVTITLPVKKE